MEATGDPVSRNVDWLVELGVDRKDLDDLNPCVPGEFTLPETLYINTGSPRVIYHGTEEGTLPLVAGRWYLLPSRLADAYPQLGRKTERIAKAPQLVAG